MSNSDHFECHSNFWPKAFWPDLECQEFGRISVSYSISCGRCKTGLKWRKLAISPPITFSSYFSTPMQGDNLLSYLPPPPCRLISFPDPLIVRRRTCLLLQPLADLLLNFMDDWSSGTLRRSLAARHPLPQLKPDPSLRHIGTKEPHSALCPVNTRFGINCIHSTENWDRASKSWNPTSNCSKLAFLSLPSQHTIWN